MDVERDSAARPVLGIIGGTGELGSALASRWLVAGYDVIVGSRVTARAEELANALRSKSDKATIRGADNTGTARDADIVVIAVPHDTQSAVLGEIAGHLDGKIVLHTVVPLCPPNISVVRLLPAGSAAQEAQALIGGRARVVSAFHNVSAAKLKVPGPVDCDVLVFGDDAAARATVAGLIEGIDLRPVDGGELANSVAAEALTAVLIGINRRNKIKGAGIRITGFQQRVG